MMETETIRELLNVAKGLIRPDVVVRNGKFVNVFTNSIDEGRIIVVKNGFIASIEEDNGGSYGGARVIDAGGLYVSPGFIDSHTHLDGGYTFGQFAEYSLRGGTTTVVSECATVACSCGMEGVESLVASTKGYPLRCYFVAPPETPPFPKMENAMGIRLKDFERLLRRDDFLGIGEAYWTRIVEGDDRVLKQAALAMSQRKNLDGHAAGARGKRLVEYVVTGITSCHESTTAEETMEKLKLGLYVMIREGFVRKELKEISKIKDMNVDMRRLILVSDFFDAVMLREEGYLDSVVKTAIRYGFSPIEAIKMATINPADYLGLRHLGAIAPLRYADLLFLRSLEDVSIEKVMVNGEVIWSEGALTRNLPPSVYPESMMHTVHAEKLTEEDFRIRAHKGPGAVRVIECVNPTVTRETSFEAKVRDGFLMADPENDIIPVAVINRNNSKRMGKGFLKGTGIHSGAVATTFTWDTANIMAIGSNEKDMKEAVNRLIDIQGGTVITKAGRVIYECPMPIYGLIPTMSMGEISDKTRELDVKMKEIGSFFERPILNIQTIPFTGLPFLRITDKGLVDIKNKRLVSIYKD
jgi:adenine deaminase